MFYLYLIIISFGLPAVWETWVRSLSLEDPLEKRTATHSRFLAWRVPWTEEPGRLQSMGSQRVRQDWATNAFTVHRTPEVCPLKKLNQGIPNRGIRMSRGWAWKTERVKICNNKTLSTPIHPNSFSGRRMKLLLWREWGKSKMLTCECSPPPPPQRKHWIITLNSHVHFRFVFFFFWLRGLQDLSSLSRDRIGFHSRWKLWVLTTGLPGNSLFCLFFNVHFWLPF